MPDERFGFLKFSIKELHEHLMQELANNPFLQAPKRGAEDPDADTPPPRQDDSPGPN